MRRIFVSAALAILLSTCGSRGGQLDCGVSETTLGESPGTAAGDADTPVGLRASDESLHNPFTHKAKYTQTVYNPVLGSFSKQKFRG